MEDRLINVLKHVLPRRPKLTIECRLREDLMVDSLDSLMILAALEDEFSITIADDDFLDVVTVKDIALKLRARGL